MQVSRLYQFLAPLLRPAALPYALGMRLRRHLYEHGTFASFAPSVPCISVGNISWGGSGKTPITGWLLGWAQQAGLRAVVLSRGYGGTPGPKPLLVTPQTSPKQAGDEPLLLAKTHPDAHIIVFPQRAQAAAFAEATLKPDLFILDDGMQHLAVQRHADLVLLRPQDLTHQWNAVIPSGSWREGAGALCRAAAFLIKLEPEEALGWQQVMEEKLGPFGKPVFSFSLQSRTVAPLLARQGPVPSLPGGLDEYTLVTGVGEPGQVRAAAVRLTGKEPRTHRVFADHHAFTEADLHALAALGLPLLCTPKDAVKLGPLLHSLQHNLPRPLHAMPVWVMQPEVVFGPHWLGEDPFAIWWQKWWQTNKHSPAPL